MRKWYPWLIVGAALAFSLAVYQRLPARVPIHWSARGQPNGWTGRTLATVFIPGIMAFVAILLPMLPAIDPRRENFVKFRSTYDLVINAVITMLGATHVAMLGKALGWPIAIERVAPVLLGAMFVVLGNVLPRARPNWWFGFRTPWTLSSDRVWERTQRLGGYVFVAGGVLLMLAAFLPPPIAVPSIVGVVALSALTPLAYSYIAWTKERPQ